MRLLLVICVISSCYLLQGGYGGRYAPVVKGASAMGAIYPSEDALIETPTAQAFQEMHDRMCYWVDLFSPSYVEGADKRDVSFYGCASPEIRAELQYCTNGAPLTVRAKMERFYDSVRNWAYTNREPITIGGITYYAPCIFNNVTRTIPSGWTIFSEGETVYNSARAYNFGNPRASPRLGFIDCSYFFYGEPVTLQTSWENSYIDALMKGVYNAGFNSVDADEYPSYFTKHPSASDSADRRGAVFAGTYSLPYYNMDFSPCLTNIISSNPVKSAREIISAFDATPYYIPYAVDYVMKKTTTEITCDIDVNALSNSVVSQGFATGSYVVGTPMLSQSNTITTVEYITNSAPTYQESIYEQTPAASFDTTIVTKYINTWIDSSTPWEFVEKKRVYWGWGMYANVYIYQCMRRCTVERDVIDREVYVNVFSTNPYTYNKTTIELEDVIVREPSSEQFDRFKRLKEYTVIRAGRSSIYHDINSGKGESLSSSAIGGLFNEQWGIYGSNFNATINSLARDWYGRAPAASPMKPAPLAPPEDQSGSAKGLPTQESYNYRCIRCDWYLEIPETGEDGEYLGATENSHDDDEEDDGDLDYPLHNEDIDPNATPIIAGSSYQNPDYSTVRDYISGGAMPNYSSYELQINQSKPVFFGLMQWDMQP